MASSSDDLAPGAETGAGEPGAAPRPKGEGAFRTIGELSEELGVAQHILRYWETRFPQLRPLQRAGNRRYYRPADVAVAQRIDRLLNREGYTIRGVQKLLAERKAETPVPPTLTPSPVLATPESEDARLPALRAIRDLLAQALEEDGR